MKRTTVLLIAAVLMYYCLLSATTAADTSTSSFVSAACDRRGIPQGSPFWGHLGTLLAQLVENTPYTEGYSFKTRTGGANSPAFGQAYCRPSSWPSECEQCLRQLSYDIWRICNSALGARVEYDGCWICYESYNF